MTKRQKEAARKILAADCETRCVYYNEGRTCAVGALAIAAGVSTATLIRHNNRAISSSFAAYIREAIRRKFGLTTEQLDGIQYENDRYYLVPQRRRSVLNRLDTF